MLTVADILAIENLELRRVGGAAGVHGGTRREFRFRVKQKRSGAQYRFLNHREAFRLERPTDRAALSH